MESGAGDDNDIAEQLQEYEFIILTVAGVIAAVLFLVGFVSFAVCMWRCYRKQERNGGETPSSAPPAPPNEEKSSSTDEQTDAKDTLLLPLTGQQWLQVPQSTRRGMKHIAREDIVHFLPKQRLEFLDTSQSKICLLSEISESNFGKVYRAEASKLQGGVASTEVLVKSLREGAERDHTLYQDFYIEMVWASGFDHPNVLQLLAVCNTGVPKYMIYEYLEFGNLLDFLRSTALVWLQMDLQSRASITDTDSCRLQPGGGQQPGKPVSNEEMVTIAIQIADGLNYISSQKIVIKDIAARNCQVGNGLCVKIAEFGLSYDTNCEDYCRIGSRDNKPLPLRWLAPETLRQNRFSTCSDIWSFGVLLWEVFSLGDRPYGHMTNGETAQYISHHKTLDKPLHCHDNVYDIMQTCWAVKPTERTPFNTLSTLLSHSVDNLNISDVSRRYSTKNTRLQISLESDTATVQETSFTS